MKNIFWLLAGWALLSAHSCPAQLVTMPGSFIKTDTNSFVVLNDLGIENHTTGAEFDNVFKFTGSTDTRLSGSNRILFSKIILEKQANAKLLLDQDIDIERSILFSGGLVDLNKRVINLGADASLLNESKSSRITGTNGGYVSIHINLDRPIVVNPGNLGAMISSSDRMGFVTIKRGHKIQSGFSMDESIQRYYDIEFANNNLNHASLSFSYFDAELNGQDENMIKVFKSDDRGIHWNMQANAIRNMVPDFEEKANMNTIYRWTLAAEDNFTTKKTLDRASVLRAWPNPASDYFFVRVEAEDDVQLQVFDVSGKLYRSLLVKKGNAVKVEGLLPGVYIIKAEGKNINKSNRVIVLDKNTNQIPGLLKTPSKNM